MKVDTPDDEVALRTMMFSAALLAITARTGKPVKQRVDEARLVAEEAVKEHKRLKEPK